MIVCRKFNFDSAHCIPSHRGKCHRIHGHRFILEIALKGDYKPEQVMLVDFGVIKHIVNQQIIERLDHNYLNNVLEDEPSAENLCMWIRDIIRVAITDSKLNVELHFVRVWESDDCYAQLGGESYVNP